MYNVITESGLYLHAQSWNFPIHVARQEVVGVPDAQSNDLGLSRRRRVHVRRHAHVN